MQFKLKPYNNNTSNEELLDDLLIVARHFKKDSLTGREYKLKGRFSVATFENRFGTWNKAVLLAGLKKTNSEKISDTELIEDLIKISKELKKNTVTPTEYKEKGKYNISTIEKRFKGWNNALVKSNLKSSVRTSFSDEELIYDLKLTSKILGKQSITNLEYNENGKFGTSIIIKRFKTWNNALKVAGIKISVNRNITQEDLIQDLKKVAKEISPKKVTYKVYKELGSFGTQTILRHFGSWNAALEKCDLEMSVNQNISEIELFQNLKDVWIKIGRQPNFIQMNKSLSKYSGWRYSDKYGSWRKALISFISYINSNIENNNETQYLDIELKAEISDFNLNRDQVDISKDEMQVDSSSNHFNEPNFEDFKNSGPKKNKETEAPYKPKTKRSISDRLKVKVLIRDGNKCKLCGITVIGENIHFDHIKPWSKGGETIFENIQVLCAKHNLAKGNYFCE